MPQCGATAIGKVFVRIIGNLTGTLELKGAKEIDVLHFGFPHKMLENLQLL